MNRFEKNRPNRSLLIRLLSLAAVVAVFALFLTALNGISAKTEQEEISSLEDAVRRGAVQCYALEGFYPDSLDYLERHYGLTYDKSRFLVVYEIIGSNLMPNVRVIPLK